MKGKGSLLTSHNRLKESTSKKNKSQGKVSVLKKFKRVVPKELPMGLPQNSEGKVVEKPSQHAIA